MTAAWVLPDTIDGIEEAAMMQPALTSVCIPAHDIGVRAANRIVELIENLPLQQDPPFAVEIAVGESLGPPRANPNAPWRAS